MNNNISDKDKKDWENFLSSNENLPNKDSDLGRKRKQKINSFDFHGYTLDEANKKIEDLIYDNYNKQVSKLIIVTGKGLHSQNEKNPYVSKNLSILRHSLPEYINNKSELMSMINSIQIASLKDGGSGAFYIYLKKKPIK